MHHHHKKSISWKRLGHSPPKIFFLVILRPWDCLQKNVLKKLHEKKHGWFHAYIFTEIMSYLEATPITKLFLEVTFSGMFFPAFTLKNKDNNKTDKKALRKKYTPILFFSHRIWKMTTRRKKIFMPWKNMSLHLCFMPPFFLFTSRDNVKHFFRNGVFMLLHILQDNDMNGRYQLWKQNPLVGSTPFIFWRASREYSSFQERKKGPTPS